MVRIESESFFVFFSGVRIVLIVSVSGSEVKVPFRGIWLGGNRVSKKRNGVSIVSRFGKRVSQDNFHFQGKIRSRRMAQAIF